MKTNARRLARAGSLTAATAAALAVLALPSAASAATQPLSISVTSSQSVINGSTTTYVADVGVTYGITYTLTAASGDTLTNVGFTDALPAGVALDDDVGETAKNCGTPFNGDNQPGQTSVTESGLEVANSVGSCTITLEYVASTPEAAAADAVSGVSYTLNGGATDTALTLKPLSLTVAADPTFGVTGLTNGQTFGYGASVAFSFSATAAANDAIPAGDIYANDDQGNTLASGGTLETDVPGAHQVSVWVETEDGYLGSETLNYTVNSPKLTAVKTTKAGDVKFNVKYLAAGSIAAEVLDGKTVVGKATVKVKAGKVAAITIKPTKAGKKLLVKHKKKGIRVKLTVLYTASGFSYIGSQPTITKSGIKLK